MTAWNLPASTKSGESKQKINCVESLEGKNSHSFGSFWFKKGYNHNLNKVLYVFGPSGEYLISGVSHKITRFLKRPSLVSSIGYDRWLLRLTVRRILNREENGDGQFVTQRSI